MPSFNSDKSSLFFLLTASFILGIIFSYLFNFWLAVNFFLTLLFYLRFKNPLLSFLVLFFLFLGSGYYFLRQVVSLPKIEVPQFIRAYRLFLEDRIKSSLPFPYENIYRGILLGSKFDDYELKQNFINSGLIHLTAVSGQNLTIMFSIFYEAFKNLPFLTPASLFWLSSVLIIFFIFLMGFEGNVLRAGIMGFLIILIKNKSGRVPIKRNILIFTLLIFMLFNPLLVLKDLGTQLSFLAILGIFYLSPILENKLKFLKINFLSKTLSETLSAQIFTYPLVLYHFGNFNLFSMISNLLVLPLIPYLMTLMSLFLFFPFKIVSWLSLPGLIYLQLVSKIFSPLVFIIKIPLFLVILIYFYLSFEIYLRLKNETIDFRFNFS